ncbi:MAG TPA: metal ABC transporter permease [Bdellovibrionales bacterium]|nr:metal ABC transporter permease [Bdellovibrionales bacterium]
MTIELLTSPFVWQALQAALLAGFLCGLVGPLFVWRRLALFGNAISHASLTPIALAQIAAVPFAVVLFPFSLGLSMLLTKIEERGFPELDSVLSIFFSGLMALGILILSFSEGGSSEAVHFLFGDILLVSRADLMLLAAVAVAVVVYAVISWRDLVLMSVHAELAAVEGVPVRRHVYLLMGLCGLAVTCVLLLMGAILATSLMVVPPMIARGFTHTLKSHVIASVLIGVAMSTGGLLLAVVLDTASGPTIAVVGMTLFIASSLIRKN